MEHTVGDKVLKRKISISCVGCHKVPAFKEGWVALVDALENPAHPDDMHDLSVETAFSLQHEPDNAYNPNALLVLFNEVPIGYVSEKCLMQVWEEFDFDNQTKYVWRIDHIKWYTERIAQWMEMTIGLRLNG